MRILSVLCLLVFAPIVWAAAPSAGVTGEVLEFKDAGGYTYLRLKTRDGETWAAVNRVRVNKGAQVTLENTMVMENFESRALNKTFPKILFGSLAAGGNSAPGAATGLPAGHAGGVKPAATLDQPVAKASGANARTVAEIVTQRAALKDKPVLLRGKVVKYNAGIMGKNWVHLRDGSGSDAAQNNDILVTTSQATRLDAVIAVKGVVRTDKDFGAGYVFKVMLEDAVLQP